MLFIALLSVVIGILVLVWPGPTLVVAGVLFGIYLLISGILQLVAAFGPHVSAGWRALSLVSGILAFILAFFSFRHIGNAIVLLALWIGISWLFHGIAVLVGGVEVAKGVPGRGWAIFYGVVLLIGGIVLVVWPIGSILTLTLVTGWWLIIMGIVEGFYAFQVRSAAKHTPAEV